MTQTKKMPAPRCEAGVTSEKQTQKNFNSHYAHSKIQFNENPQPHNLEAESALIENLIFKPEKVGLATSIAVPADFYSKLRGSVFQKIVEFYKTERIWNLTTLTNSFRADPSANKYRDFFDDLLPFTGELVGHHARIVKNCANARKLISVTYKAHNDLHNGAAISEVRAALSVALQEVAR